MRYNHWIKNILVLLPAFFAGTIYDTNTGFYLSLAFIAFCLFSSSIYILNDIWDIKFDREHPRKKHRPIASGAISVNQGYLISLILFVMGILVSLLLPRNFLLLITLYYFINIAYGLYLKHIAIVDILIITSGFLIRILAGGVAVGIPVSYWMISITFLLAVLLILGKRRDDVLLLNETGKMTRSTVNNYRLKYVDIALIVFAVLVLVLYFFYSISPEVISRTGNTNLVWSSPMVGLGIFRYFYLVFKKKESGSPVGIFWNDRILQLIILTWGIVLIAIIYV